MRRSTVVHHAGATMAMPEQSQIAPPDPSQQRPVAGNIKPRRKELT